MKIKFEEYSRQRYDYLLNEHLLEKFNYKLINEGLIKSVDFDTTISKLEDILIKKEITHNLQLLGNSIMLNFECDNIYRRKEFLEQFNIVLNICGYYVSFFKCDNIKNKRGIGIVDVVKNKKFEIQLNKKYDYEVGVPEYLYHVTDRKFLDKIKREGIKQKSEKTIEYHPERVYVFGGVKDAESFADKKKEEDINFDPVIIKINSKLLNKLKLHKDPKFDKYSSAYYTYDNISANSIVEISE